LRTKQKLFDQHFKINKIEQLEKTKSNICTFNLAEKRISRKRKNFDDMRIYLMEQKVTLV
jgi:hypothetical protein